jgi:hypothetical protein
LIIEELAIKLFAELAQDFFLDSSLDLFMKNESNDPLDDKKYYNRRKDPIKESTRTIIACIIAYLYLPRTTLCQIENPSDH